MADLGSQLSMPELVKSETFHILENIALNKDVFKFVVAHSDLHITILIALYIFSSIQILFILIIGRLLYEQCFSNKNLHAFTLVAYQIAGSIKHVRKGG